MSSVNVGDVESTLRVVDGFSAPFQAAIQAAKGAGEAMGSSFASLGESLSKTFTDPQQGISDLTAAVGGGLKDALSSIGPEAALAAGALGGMVAAASAVAGIVFGLGDHAATAGEQVLAFSERTGIAVENVGQLQFAVTAAGGSLDTVAGILQRLQLKEAAGGGGKFADALKDININAADFAKMDNESRLLALAKGFQGGAKSGNEMKDAIALMGRSGAENIPMLMKLTDDLMASGAKLGVQWTKDSVEAAEKFKVGLGTVETALGGIATRIGLALLPALTDMVVSLAKSPTFMDDVTQGTVALAHGLGYVIEGVGYTAAALLDLGADLSKSAVDFFASAAVADKFGLAIAKALQFIPEFSGSAKLAIVGLTSDLKTHQEETVKAAGAYNSLKSGGDSVRAATDTLSGALKGLTAQSMAAVETNLALNRAHNDGTAAAAAFAKAVQGIVDALEGDSKKQLETKAAIDQVIASGNQDVDVKGRVVAALEKLMKAHVDLSATERAYFEQNKSLTAESQKGTEALAKLHEDYFALIEKGAGTTLSAQLAANQRWFDDEIAKLEKTRAYNESVDAEEDQLRANKQVKDDNARAAQEAKDTKFADETKKLWGDYYALLQKEEGDTLDSKLASIDTWEQAQVDSIGRLLDTGQIGPAQYYARIIALDADAQAKRLQSVTEYAQKVQQSQQAIEDLWDQTDAIILARSGNTVDAQIKGVQKWADDQVSKLKANDVDWQQHYDAIQALAAAKTDDIIHASDPLWAAWKSANVDMRSSFASMWENVLSGANSWKDAMMQPINDLRSQWQKIIAAILADWENQLFNPLLKLAHNAMGSLMNMLTGGGGGGGLFSGLFGSAEHAGLGAIGLGGGAGAGGIGTSVGGLSLPGAEAAGGAGGGIGLGGLAATIGGGAGAIGAGAISGFLLSKITGSKVIGSIGGGLSGAAEGALIGSIVPGVGTAIGAILGGLSGVIGGLFGAGSAGRTTVVDWVNQTFGSFDKFHGVLNSLSDQFKAVGINSEQVWIDLTQKVGRNDKEGAQAAIQAVIDDFKKLQTQQQATADTSTTATETITQNAQSAASTIQQTFSKPISIKYEYDAMNAPPSVPPGADNAGGQAEGGTYVVSRPTWFLAGEAGSEVASFSGGSSRKGALGTPVTIHATIVNQIDGYEAGKALVPHIIQLMPGDLMRALGLPGV